jgi:hypothetical protein
MVNYFLCEVCVNFLTKKKINSMTKHLKFGKVNPIVREYFKDYCQWNTSRQWHMTFVYP